MPVPTDAGLADLDLTIRDYLARKPQAVDVLLDLRMGCLGCDFSAFDTLRQALGAHGIALPRYLDHLSRHGPSAQGESRPPSFPGDDR
jgi:hybrid cluster-associated redox disulfide protein